MKQPLISVVIPTYNCSKFILKTIESVLSQTYLNIEIIVIDDGSTDDTVSLISQYSNDNVVLVSNEHTGNVGLSRNMALALSKGDYVAFMDSDDIWLPNKIEKQYYLLDKYDLICTNAVVIDELDNIIKEKYFTKFNYCHEINLKDEILENCLITSSVVAKRECFADGVKFEDIYGHYGEDYYLWLRLLINGTKIFYLDECLVKYRIHSNNSFKNRNAELLMLCNTIRFKKKVKY